MAEKTENKGFGGRRGGGRRGNEEEWHPVTKLGRLVKSGKVETLEEIFRFSIPIKESQIVDRILKDQIKEEVCKVKPVQKQTQAGQRTRFKAYVVVGDSNGHLGLGWKCSKEVQGAIKGAIIHAKLNLMPVRLGYWGNKIGAAHTVPMKVTGASGSVRIRLIPAPRGTAIVAAPASKKILQFAGIRDCYTSSRGSTRTKGNFVKATFEALVNTYKYQNPDFWGKPVQDEHPFVTHNKFFSEVREKTQGGRGGRREGGDRRDGDRRRDGGNRREGGGGFRGGRGDRDGGPRREGRGRRDAPAGETAEAPAATTE